MQRYRTGSGQYAWHSPQVASNSIDATRILAMRCLIAKANSQKQKARHCRAFCLLPEA
jgi:hypothetical protein